MATNSETANSFTAVTPRLHSQGLIALRNNAITPMIVNRQYEGLATQQGDTISVPITSKASTYPVSPSSNAPTDVQPITTRVVDIRLNQHHASSFTVSDKNKLEILAGTIPGAASENVGSLIDLMDTTLLGNYTGVWNTVGVIGSEPFAPATDTANADKIGGTKVLTEIGRILNEAKAPTANRRIVLNPAAQAAALGVPAFSDQAFGATALNVRDGTMPAYFGFTFFMNQNVPRHIAGNASALTGDARRGTTGTPAVGATELQIASLTMGDFNVGDIFTIAGDLQSYVAVSQNASTLTIAPGLAVAPTSGAKLTVLGDHNVNLAFQQNAIAFVNRTLPREPGDTRISSSLDPLSGLALRLERKRENKQEKFEWDALWGTALLRPEHAVRVIS